MQKLSGLVFLVIAVVFGFMLVRGQRPADQTLMELQELPAKGIDIQACSEDVECIPIAESCCDCSQGGTRTAINRKFYKFRLEELNDQCLLASCQQAESTDASCTEARPQCVNGQCQMQ